MVGNVISSLSILIISIKGIDKLFCKNEIKDLVIMNYKTRAFIDSNFKLIKFHIVTPFVRCFYEEYSHIPQSLIQ